jgi:hypothetical protein
VADQGDNAQSLGRNNLGDVRVTLIDALPLPAGILRRLVEESEGLELVAESPLPIEDLPTWIADDSDVLIVGSSAIEERAICALLQSHPSIKIVAISPAGRHGFLYELAPNVVVLNELSGSELVAAIRQSIERCEERYANELRASRPDVG